MILYVFLLIYTSFRLWYYIIIHTIYIYHHFAFIKMKHEERMIKSIFGLFSIVIGAVIAYGAGIPTVTVQ